MHLIWKRYARSGYAPGWFYVLAAIAFAGVAIWSVVAGDWLVAAVAVAMAGAAIAGGRVMRRLSAGLAESSTRARPAASGGADDDKKQRRGSP